MKFSINLYTNSIMYIKDNYDNDKYDLEMKI